MSFEKLVDEARTFERSSGFRYGDRLGFSIGLCEGLMLKGATSAGAYLDSLGLDKLPDRVMVVGPGNGGLVTECYNRGAKRVIAVETRHRFQATLQRVLKLQESAWAINEVEGCSYRIVSRWEQVRENDGFKDVDLILWPEGLREITAPKEIFRILSTALNPGGKLVVEVQHGRHKWVEKINSWQPSEHAIVDMSKEIFGGPWATKAPGRNGQASSVVTLVQPGKKAPKKAAKAKAPAPKKAAAKAKPKKKAWTPSSPAQPVADDEPVVLLDEAPEPLKKKAKKKKTKKKVTKQPAGREKPAAKPLPAAPKPPVLPPETESLGE